jgi:hypothetical protein
VTDLGGRPVMRQMKWTERTFCFDFPVGVYPGIVERLRGTPARIEALVLTATEETLRRRDGDAWSILEHIGHLSDLHALDETRLGEYLAGATRLTAADMANRRTHEAAYNDQSAVDLLERFGEERDGLVATLETLTEEQVSRVAMHPRLGRPLRLVDWCFFVAEHDDHHVARIRELLG